MKDKPKFNFKSVKTKSVKAAKKIARYRLIIFFVFICAVYAYVYLNISTYANVAPSDAQIQSKVKSAAVPRIDKSVVDQLQTLQDNSVSVKALFNQARTSPFQ